MSAGYSCNDNQNYFVSEGRTTSRVLQNPGGNSSIQLAWDSPKTKKNKNNFEKNNGHTLTNNHEATKSNPIVVTSNVLKEKSNRAFERKETNPILESNPLANISNNAFASGSNMNSGNFITGRPSSRVLHPPGGKSSISLG